MSRTSGTHRRRADAERNIGRILRAARQCLGRDPGASIDEIARTAGVGRVTLYGHFSSRAKLVESALADALREGEETLSTVDLSGDSREALSRLIDASWQLVAESMSLLDAAQDVLSPQQIRDLHADPARRLEDLLRRGQREGVFRFDLPESWLVSVAHSVLHGAVTEIEAGRLRRDDAGRIITATIQAVWSNPASQR